MKERESNIELLRIISMVLIIFHHLSYHGGFNFDSFPFNWYIIHFFVVGGKIGVDIFVLISGYFLIKSTNFKISKAIKLWLQLVFYSVLIYLLFTIFGNNNFNIRIFIQSFLPVIYDTWWFASSYFILFLLSPFINTLLKSLNQDKYKLMLLLMTVCWCIIPTFLRTMLQSNNLVWFTYLYCVGGYIKLYKDKINIKSVYFLIMAIVMYIGVALIKKDLYEMNMIPAFLIALFMFLWAKGINIKSNRFINIVSSATFGVYLIHDNSYVRSILWSDIFNVSSYLDSSYLIPYSIYVVAVIFIFCTIIELIRINLFEKFYMKYIKKIDSKKGLIVDKILDNKLIKKL